MQFTIPNDCPLPIIDDSIKDNHNDLVLNEIPSKTPATRVDLPIEESISKFHNFVHFHINLHNTSLFVVIAKKESSEYLFNNYKI
jgi:hypothetical protein